MYEQVEYEKNETLSFHSIQFNLETIILQTATCQTKNQIA